ncbi:MAG: L-threonylcarbamoyladenylate synthase [Desulfatiglandaceae bacterium]|jgi:L-threonylcarbamoyladenylate synthase
MIPNADGDEAITGLDSLIRVNGPRPDEGAIRRAVRIILDGGVVAFPTESFYGLGVDATRHEAVGRLFRIKARDQGQPILILIPSLESLEQYVAAVPKVARELINVFWPGGLTLIFEATEQVLPLLTGGTGKIGVRLSSHPVAALLACTLGHPITGTSANLSGNPPARSAGEVSRAFGKGMDLILDGGRTQEVKASTVLDVTVDPPVVLREGMISTSDLKGFI